MTTDDLPDLPTLRERVRHDIDARLDGLRDRFGEFPVDRERVPNDPDRFRAGLEMAADGWRGDAGAWITDPERRALFIRHEAAPGAWGIPGGGHEPGESHRETARREVREETGLEVSLTGVWRARRRTFFDVEAPARDLEMLTVWFEGTATGGDLQTADDEVLDVEWFEVPPASVVDEIRTRVERWVEN